MYGAPPPQGGGGYGYPPQQGGYPPQQGGYPPQQGGYPPQQGGYPPQQGGYPPQQGGYPPQQGGYPPQQGGYPPQQGGYPPQQGGYPPQQGGYGGAGIVGGMAAAVVGMEAAMIGMMAGGGGMAGGPHKGDRLHKGHKLHHNEFIQSANGFKFIHQADGNVVLYNRSSAPVWASNTCGRPTHELEMQHDGNLVLYAPGRQPIWASNTSNSGGDFFVMQTDGNGVLYDGGRAVWATNTVDPTAGGAQVPYGGGGGGVPQYGGGSYGGGGGQQRVVYVGPSDSNTKRISVPGVVAAESFPANPQEAGWNDRFYVTVHHGNAIEVRRTDFAGGWGQGLQIRCTIAPQPQIVMVGPSGSNTKRVPVPGVVSAESFPANPQEAGWNDRFQVTVYPNEIEVRRVDFAGGWGQGLQIRCMVAA